MAVWEIYAQAAIEAHLGVALRATRWGLLNPSIEYFGV